MEQLAYVETLALKRQASTSKDEVTTYASCLVLFFQLIFKFFSGSHENFLVGECAGDRTTVV